MFEKSDIKGRIESYRQLYDDLNNKNQLSEKDMQSFYNMIKDYCELSKSVPLNKDCGQEYLKFDGYMGGQHSHNNLHKLYGMYVDYKNNMPFETQIAFVCAAQTRDNGPKLYPDKINPTKQKQLDEQTQKRIDYLWDNTYIDEKMRADISKAIKDLNNLPEKCIERIRKYVPAEEIKAQYQNFDTVKKLDTRSALFKETLKQWMEGEKYYEIMGSGIGPMPSTKTALFDAYTAGVEQDRKGHKEFQSLRKGYIYQDIMSGKSTSLQPDDIKALLKDDKNLVFTPSILEKITVKEDMWKDINKDSSFTAAQLNLIRNRYMESQIPFYLSYLVDEVNMTRDNCFLEVTDNGKAIENTIKVARNISSAIQSDIKYMQETEDLNRYNSEMEKYKKDEKEHQDSRVIIDINSNLDRINRLDKINPDVVEATIETYLKSDNKNTDILKLNPPKINIGLFSKKKDEEKQKQIDAAYKKYNEYIVDCADKGLLKELNRQDFPSIIGEDALLKAKTINNTPSLKCPMKPDAPYHCAAERLIKRAECLEKHQVEYKEQMQEKLKKIKDFKQQVKSEGGDKNPPRTNAEKRKAAEKRRDALIKIKKSERQ